MRAVVVIVMLALASATIAIAMLAYLRGHEREYVAPRGGSDDAVQPWDDWAWTRAHATGLRRA